MQLYPRRAERSEIMSLAEFMAKQDERYRRQTKSLVLTLATTSKDPEVNRIREAIRKCIKSH